MIQDISLYPELKRIVVTILGADHDWPQFLLVSFFQNSRIKSIRFRQKLNVFSVTFNIPSQP